MFHLGPAAAASILPVIALHSTLFFSIRLEADPKLRFG